MDWSGLKCVYFVHGCCNLDGQKIVNYDDRCRVEVSWGCDKVPNFPWGVRGVRMGTSEPLVTCRLTGADVPPICRWVWWMGRKADGGGAGLGRTR